MTSTSNPAPLQNIYYERKTGTARPCYICKRPTQTVLATLKTEDFLYTCDGHLTDPASPIAAPPSAAPGPSAEDIRKVISDYHAKEVRKNDKTDDKNADTAKSKDQDQAKDQDNRKVKTSESPKSKSPPLTPSIPVSTSPPTNTHRKFSLHRQIFDMRRAELKRKEQGAKAKEVDNGMPQVPRGMF